MTRYRLYRIEPCPVLKPDGSCEHLLSKCPGCLNDGTREVRTEVVVALRHVGQYERPVYLEVADE